ncbi:MAG: hypothetical protein M1823_003198 [Watsoniomyces obsoletus]|nr:MAG: hypothetical protein M1823_003198 [Watsoniomyces obsoletus]
MLGTVAGLAFAFWRWMQIITLIPTLGMLAWFVRGFTSSNVLTPNYVLVLFITSVLATAWALGTLLMYHRTRHSAFFVSFVDFCFAAALIAGVVVLRRIGGEDCNNFAASGFYADLGPFGSWGSSWGSEWARNPNKTCAMLKACFAFSIMNIIFFFTTSFLALFIHRAHEKKEGRHEPRGSSSHSGRHTHRRSNSHASHNSRHSRHSHHHQSRREPFV